MSGMTTDIKELMQTLKAAALRAKVATEEYASGHMSAQTCTDECAEFNRLTDSPDQTMTLIEALEAKDARIAELETYIEIHERTAVAAIERAEMAGRRAVELQSRAEAAESIRAAAEKLVRCKGRYHSEQNYRALAELFGVTTPDLPPLPSDGIQIQGGE